MKQSTIHIMFVIGLSCWLGISESKAQSIRMNTLPEGYHRAYVEGNDTIAIFNLREVYIFPPVKFRNKREEAKYWKLVRDVKKTLPYAKMVYETLIETYEYIETLPTEKERQEHLKRMEKELFAQYKPELKKMTLSQGKLLIKLVDRQTSSTGYELVKAFMGPFKAGFYQAFAALFGASLKKQYDPTGDDALTERVILLVESGQL